MRQTADRKRLLADLRRGRRRAPRDLESRRDPALLSPARVARFQETRIDLIALALHRRRRARRGHPGRSLAGVADLEKRGAFGGVARRWNARRQRRRAPATRPIGPGHHASRARRGLAGRRGIDPEKLLARPTGADQFRSAQPPDRQPRPAGGRATTRTEKTHRASTPSSSSACARCPASRARPSARIFRSTTVHGTAVSTSPAHRKASGAGTIGRDQYRFARLLPRDGDADHPRARLRSAGSFWPAALDHHRRDVGAEVTSPASIRSGATSMTIRRLDENPAAHRPSSAWWRARGTKRRAKTTSKASSSTRCIFPTQNANSGNTLIVRVKAGDPHALVPAIKREVQALDPDQPIGAVATMEKNIGASLAARRLTMSLLGAFAGLALVLASVGIYGVMALSTTQRTREMGIRFALGASRGDVLRLILGQGISLIADRSRGRITRGLRRQPRAEQPALRRRSARCRRVDRRARHARRRGLRRLLSPARRASQVNPIEALRTE